MDRERPEQNRPSRRPSRRHSSDQIHRPMSPSERRSRSSIASSGDQNSRSSMSPSADGDAYTASTHTTDSNTRSSLVSPSDSNDPSFQRSPANPQMQEVRPGKKHNGPVHRLVNGWWDRLLGAASDRSFSDQEERYESHRTSRDYIWNTIGYTAWGMVFPILTIVVTQLSGVEQAGMFSLAFVTGTLLMILANYGVRAYQISDLSEKHSFVDYRINRLLTCAIMLLVGWGLCALRGYDAQMFSISMGVFIYKMVDGLADVYEGRLQQHDKLYLAGISQTFRSLVVFIGFIIVLAVTRDLGIASVAMAIVAIASLLIVTLPLALFETPKSRRCSLGSVADLFRDCFPLFAALFLYALIDAMPKFVMDGVLTYDNQLYFNALYFPAQAILIVAGFIYRPLLVRMAQAWADLDHRRRFDLFIVVMLALIVVITVIAVGVMGWIGIPIMSFLYGIDFSDFRDLSFIMLAAGGMTAGIDFLYQVITVMRRQKVVTKLYLVTFVASLIILPLLINFTGLPGAVIGYMIVMGILFVLLVREYIVERHASSLAAKQEQA